jgi:hypothetical protein
VNILVVGGGGGGAPQQGLGRSGGSTGGNGENNGSNTNTDVAPPSYSGTGTAYVKPEVMEATGHRRLAVAVAVVAMMVQVAELLGPGALVAVELVARHPEVTQQELAQVVVPLLQQQEVARQVRY